MSSVMPRTTMSASAAGRMGPRGTTDIIATRPMTARVVTLGMDDTERKILRRRRHYLADNIRPNCTILEALGSKGLLTEEQIEIIQEEKNQHLQVLKMLEFLSVSPEDGAFATFCSMLESHSYIWVARNLEADYKIEKGLVHVEEEVLYEAGMLVHRKFGSSKRFSEGEKREIQELMASKLQVSKDEWNRQLEETNALLAAERAENARKDRKSRQIATELRDFARHNDDKLTTHAHDMTTTTKSLELSVEESNKDILTKLHDNLKKVLNRFSEILTHRENIMREKEKRSHTVQRGVGETEISSTPSPTNSDDSDREVDKDRLIKRLNKKITELEQVILDHEDQLQTLQEELANNKNGATVQKG